MPLRRLFNTLSLLILCLSIGCQDDQPSATPAAIETRLSATTTETMETPSESIAVSVPRGKPPVVDGAISPGEWEQAVLETYADGSELLFLYNEGFLYLGMRASTTEMIVGNVLLERGETITILHASAALGTGIYQRERDIWGLARGFVWRCRDTGNSQVAQEEREAFLQGEGWVATNSRIGTPNELEYQIKTTGESLRMAVNYIKASETNVKIPWPDGLEDGSTQPTPGGLPEQLDFSPEADRPYPLGTADYPWPFQDFPLPPPYQPPVRPLAVHTRLWEHKIFEILHNARSPWYEVSCRQ